MQQNSNNGLFWGSISGIAALCAMLTVMYGGMTRRDDPDAKAFLYGPESRTSVRCAFYSFVLVRIVTLILAFMN